MPQQQICAIGQCTLLRLGAYPIAQLGPDVTMPSCKSGLAKSPLKNAAAHGGLAFLSGLLWPEFIIAPSDCTTVTGPVVVERGSN